MKYKLYCSFFLLILLISCQGKLSKEELFKYFDKHKSTVLNILSYKDNEYLNNNRVENLIYVFNKKIKNYSLLEEEKYKYILNNIKSDKIRNSIEKNYIFNNVTRVYQIATFDLKFLEYIYNIFKLSNVKRKNNDKIKKIIAQDENFLKHPYSFYNTIYLNPISKHFEIFEKESIKIDSKITLIEGILYEHSNSFKIFSKKKNILIVKVINNNLENIKSDIDIYKIIFNISNK